MDLLRNNRELQFGASELWQNHREVQQTKEECYFREEGKIEKDCFEQKLKYEK